MGWSDSVPDIGVGAVSCRAVVPDVPTAADVSALAAGGSTGGNTGGEPRSACQKRLDEEGMSVITIAGAGCLPTTGTGLPSSSASCCWRNNLATARPVSQRVLIWAQSHLLSQRWFCAIIQRQIRVLGNDLLQRLLNFFDRR